MIIDIIEATATHNTKVYWRLVKLPMGFYKDKLTIKQLSIIGRITEKKYEFRQDLWQVLVDLKKAYLGLRNRLYNIM